MPIRGHEEGKNRQNAKKKKPQIDNKDDDKQTAGGIKMCITKRNE